MKRRPRKSDFKHVKKDYVVYRFPSYHGTPKRFKSYLAASVYFFFSEAFGGYVCELEAIAKDDGLTIWYQNAFGGVVFATYSGDEFL